MFFGTTHRSAHISTAYNLLAMSLAYLSARLLFGFFIFFKGNLNTEPWYRHTVFCVRDTCSSRVLSEYKSRCVKPERALKRCATAFAFWKPQPEGLIVTQCTLLHTGMYDMMLHQHWSLSVMMMGERGREGIKAMSKIFLLTIYAWLFVIWYKVLISLSTLLSTV